MSCERENMRTYKYAHYCQVPKSFLVGEMLSFWLCNAKILLDHRPTRERERDTMREKERRLLIIKSSAFKSCERFSVIRYKFYILYIYIEENVVNSVKLRFITFFYWSNYLYYTHTYNLKVYV